MYNSTATSNYDLTAAFDRQNPDASRGFFSSKHNISLSTSFAEEFVGDDLETRLGLTFVARSGRPYSLTFSGGSVFNDNASGTENALIYLPTGVTDPNIAPPVFSPTTGLLTGGSNPLAVQQLVDFAGSLDCAKDYIGRSIDRNTCSNDWFFDLDLSFSQELPGPGRFFGRNDSFKLYATVDNFLNLLDGSWNVQRRRDFAGRQELIGVSGVDAQGRYIITPLPGGCAQVNQSGCTATPPAVGFTTPASNFAADNGVNVSSSVWRLKVGISYEF